MNSRTLLLCALTAVVALGAGFLLGRGTGASSGMDLRHNPDGAGTPVATFANDSVSVEELTRRFAEMTPAARARYQTLEQKREYLEGLVRFELLAHEAQARGLTADADVRETTKKVMVQRLLQQELDEKVSPPSEDELAAYYQRHLADYVRPEQLRLSHLFLAAPRADAARVAQQRELAQRLLAEAAALAPQDFRGFGALAVKHSEEPRTRALEGDLRYLSAQQLTEGYGAEVAQAAALLTTPGQLAPLVQTDAGFHLLKLRTREPAQNQSLDTVRPQLISRISYERRTQRYDAFLEALRSKWKLQIDNARLAQVPVDPQAPALPPSGPTPGFIPPPSRSGGPAAQSRVPPSVVPQPTSGRVAPSGP